MRPPRLIYIGGIYHIVARCNNREFFFKNNQDFDLYSKMLIKARAKYNVTIHAFCFTNNHIHLIIGTPYNKNLSLFMQYVQGHFAKAYNKKYGKMGRFWAGRYLSTIIDSEEYYMNCLMYIELNMVRNKAVKHPEKWMYSSYKQHARGRGILKIDYHPQYLKLGKTETQRQKVYRQMVKNKMQEVEFVKKQEVISKGLVYGSKEFIKTVIKEYATHEYFKNKKEYRVSNQAHALKKTRCSSG